MHVLLLGPTELRGRDGASLHIGGAKRRAVLATLALDLNRVVPVERLMEAAWGDTPPATARTALQGHVAALRPALTGDFRLVTRQPGYCLEADRGRVDAHRAADLLAAAASEDDETAVRTLRAALDLWRGPALVDCGSDLLRRVSAPRLAEVRLQTLEQLAERMLRTGCGGLVTAELADALEEQPLREPLARLLMLCLHQDGRHAQALQQYHRIRERLAEELGVDPGAALQSALADVLRGGPPEGSRRPEEPAPSTATMPPPVAFPPSANAPVPAQLPRQPAAFVGRDDALATLAAAVADDPGALCVVTGPAGVGKTSVALRWAHSAVGQYPDGQLFADLQGFDDSGPVDPASVLHGFLTALGVTPRDIPADTLAAQALFRSTVAGRRLLVVLDNARRSEQVRPLLPGGGACTVVVTSRNRLDGLAVRDGARRVGLETLTGPESVALLTAVVTDGRMARSPASGRALAQLCGGLPLALRITAARLAAHPAWPLEAVVDELLDEQNRLAALSTEDSDVTAALSLSVRTLDPDARAVVPLLGVHPGADTDRYAAAALSGLSVGQAGRALAKLGAAHLVTETLPGRFSRHDLVRLYARQYPSDDGSATRRLIDYYLHAAYVASRLADPSGRPCCDLPAWCTTPPAIPRWESARQALHWYAAEADNLGAIVELAFRADLPERAWRLTVLMWPLMTWQSHRYWIPVLEHGMEAARRAEDPVARTRVGNLLGWALIEAGSAVAAVRHLEESVESARRGGDRCDEATGLINLGLAHGRTGRPTAALAHYEAAADAAGSIGDHRTTALALHHLSQLSLGLDAAEQALTYSSRALELRTTVTLGLLEVLLLDDHAVALRRCARPDQAMPLLREGLAQARREEFISAEATILDHLADVLADLDRPGEAAAHRERARELHDRMESAGNAPEPMDADGSPTG
ncbi:BTAD domain-containing putative transcriptional regulator [Streptomyces sp. NPDC002870]|uniref:AfsR/SARP family transcriptional regulator n=1 Tax=Streptomyces sp. NPDC002870 TaxID=3364666 RepID=UPI0036AF2A6A